MRPSNLTIIVGAHIGISAYFMQQAWVAARKIFGINNLLLSIAVIAVLILCLIVIRSLKKRAKPINIISIFIVYALAVVFAWKQPYVTEKTHILEYGILGWLAMRDYSKGGGIRLKGMAYALVFILIVGCLDEGFQKIIPRGVGEIRDVVTNVISGIFGMILYALG